MTGCRLTRRGLAAGLGATAWFGRGARAETNPLPREITLTVAGPDGGLLDHAARALIPSLQSHLPAGTQLAADLVGGVDGVTGANQFAAQSAPDGGAVLLAPGSAALAWLVGDTRVHFEPSHWLPILADHGAGIVVRRAGASPIGGGGRWRVAVGSPTGPELAALLGLELLGARFTAVPGLGEDAAALLALRRGEVDVALVRTRKGLADLAANDGGRAVFALDSSIDAAGAPQLSDLITPARTQSPLFRAWRCAASAAGLRYALVLPVLTAPAAVSLWRRAVSASDGSETLASAQTVAAIRGALSLDQPALLALRGWLADRLGWQPT